MTTPTPPCKHNPPDLPPVGEEYSLEYCRLCWRFHTHPASNLFWGGDGKVKGNKAWACKHLGKETGDLVECPTCPKGRKLKIFQCAVHKQCIRGAGVGPLHGCRGCNEYEEHTIEECQWYEMSQGFGDGLNFNPSAIRYRGRLLVAFRHKWTRSRIKLAVMGEDWQVQKVTELKIGLSKAQEDPRFFLWKDRLHIAFTAYDGRSTTLGIARLGEDLKVEYAWLPELKERQSWEKNWGFFTPADNLFCVYSISPKHIILLHEEHRVSRVYETENKMVYPWGHLRGGASPVLYNNEWYSWFHTRKHIDKGHYTLGLYCFQNKPPFKVTRYINRPLVSPSRTDQKEPHKPVVIFPGGALIENNKWNIICGWMDESIRRWEFPIEYIERELILV